MGNLCTKEIDENAKEADQPAYGNSDQNNQFKHAGGNGFHIAQQQFGQHQEDYYQNQPAGSAHIHQSQPNGNLVNSQFQGSFAGQQRESHLDTQPKDEIKFSQYQPIVEPEYKTSIFDDVSQMNSMNAKVKQRYDKMNPMTPEQFPGYFQQYRSFSKTQKPIKHKSEFWTYEGQVKNSHPHGFGTMITSDGTLEQGFFNEGHPVYIRRIQPNGEMFEGAFQDRKYHGQGTKTESSGATMFCKNWIAGLPDGEAESKAPNGRVLFRGQFKQGKKHGPGESYDERRRCTDVGTFTNNEIEGDGKRYYDDGKVYIGKFRNGQEEGPGLVTLIDGRQIDGNFVAGMATGDGFLVKNNGQRIKQTFRNNRRV